MLRELALKEYQASGMLNTSLHSESVWVEYKLSGQLYLNATSDADGVQDVGGLFLGYCSN